MERTLLKDVVYRRIKDLIVSGYFPMGSKLSENRLSDLLKANIAPIRDALKRLESEKLVERRPKSGTYVFSICQSKLDKLLRFRFIIESEAAVIACGIDRLKFAQELGAVYDIMVMDQRSGNSSDYLKQDSVFHRTMVAECDNPYFIESYQLIANIMDTVRNYLGDNEDHLMRSMNQHRQIIEAVNGGDAAKLRGILAKHILPEHGAYWTEENVCKALPKD
ncbi:MAG: GntR family transcriptional regulator [Succinivibrio sp.]